MKRLHLMARTRGFSLVEVMVALIVISVGLLGIAKMQALSLANTSSARMRSLAAIEAASLASAMHANRSYWASVPTPFSVTSTLGAITASSDAPLLANLATDYCNSGKSAPCTPPQLADSDLQGWITDLHSLIPSDTATISCPVGFPLACTITISWVESAVAANQQQAAQTAANGLAAIQNSTYTLYVQP